MASTPEDAQLLFNAAVGALQAGRAAEARRDAETLAALAPDNASVLLLLATACRAGGDSAAEEAALDGLLALEPRLARGLIMKGDCRTRAGDEEAGAGFYRAALIAADGAEQPPQMIAELRRAEAAVARFKAAHMERLEAALVADGFESGSRTARFSQSLDIMAGRAQAYFQEPTGYFFPELPQRQFYAREEFDWAPAVESATDAIRAEILAYRAARGEGFRPYIVSHADSPRVDQNPLLDNVDWSALFLVENGQVADDIVALCPETWAAVRRAPLPFISRMGPTAMFSLLRPGARINPHTGVFNTRLVCHLPLIVPAGCGFRVGNQIREWEVGKLLVFDDTIEHEAWNSGGEDRMILIFDIWRPELTEAERREVSALLAFTRPKEN
jgi:aspartyl/asparaginyl beta-hydroxylase (cupin superfamily)